MVVRGFGPFAGWDLDDPTEITNLMEVLEVMLHSVPSARVRSRRVFRPYNETQFASLRGLVELGEHSPQFRVAVERFVAFFLNDEVNTAILVRAAQEIQNAASSIVPVPTNAPSAKNGANVYPPPPPRPTSNQEASMSAHMISNMADKPEERNDSSSPPRLRTLGPRPPLPMLVQYNVPSIPSRPLHASPFGPNLYPPGATTTINGHKIGGAPPPASYPMPGQPAFGDQRPLMPRPGPPRISNDNSPGYDSQDDDDDDEGNNNDNLSGKKTSSTPKNPSSESRAKHKPRKPRNEKPIDENIDKENARVGIVDKSKLQINFYTLKLDGTRGELVRNRYGHRVDFNSRDSVKKLNAWRSQIISRNFNPIKKKREYWLVTERSNVMQLIRQQFATRSTLKWAKLANDYNKQYHDQIQPEGSKLLFIKKRVNRILNVPRQTPWRTRASIEHAASKWQEYKALSERKKQQEAEGVKTDDSEAADDNASVHYSEDEIELRDPNPNPAAVASAISDTPTPISNTSTSRPVQNIRKKPPGRPISKPVNRKRPRSTSTVSDETESEEESHLEPEAKRRKYNAKGGKKRKDDDDDVPTFPNLPPRKPAP